MARSNNSFIKKQKADRKAKKKKEKLENRLEKKRHETSGKLEDMIAYVDEFGNISDTPPEPPEDKDKKKKNSGSAPTD
ncbi:cold-shock protein [Echinicola strongylocentroti]|uniref:Cold-shock protein n=1 Tax=Echinicola strongylocentroti TaxID=1795355 RepID=A0A2Z4ICQ3_9BACT|nr:cold-shock protein [Echinicola strongylocentroti]AWW28742.1 cold-shock protein [Echinicola strongylocentroti]